MWYKNANKESSPNLISLINAVIVGAGGTSIAYVILSIPFILSNILCIVLMIFTIWIGSMIGYDKIMQLIEQMSRKG